MMATTESFTAKTQGERAKPYIYVASSWRNARQPWMVAFLRDCGFDVYDFRNPAPGDKGFAWDQIDSNWTSWSTPAFVEALEHPIAEKGFRNDFEAMQRANMCVLVLPCGRSAHLELGWFAGQGKPTAIWSPEPMEPELMVKMCDLVTESPHAVAEWVVRQDQKKGGDQIKG